MQMTPQFQVRMPHIVVTKTPLQMPSHLPQSHQTHPTKALQAHLTTTQNPTRLNVIPQP
jgi:hypothetical protein